jgi:hypothetical protein
LVVDVEIEDRLERCPGGLPPREPRQRTSDEVAALDGVAALEIVVEQEQLGERRREIVDHGRGPGLPSGFTEQPAEQPPGLLRVAERAVCESPEERFGGRTRVGTA